MKNRFLVLHLSFFLHSSRIIFPASLNDLIWFLGWATNAEGQKKITIKELRIQTQIFPY